MFFKAVFSIEEDGISVMFPELPGCFTCGFDMEEALFMAKEALELHVSDMDEEEMIILEADEIYLSKDEFIVLIPGEIGKKIMIH